VLKVTAYGIRKLVLTIISTHGLSWKKKDL